MNVSFSFAYNKMTDAEADKAYDFYQDGSVVYMSNKYLNDYNPIYKQLYEIGFECSSVFSPCQGYESDCDGYVVMYVDGAKDLKMTFDLLQEMASKITSYLVILPFPKIGVMEVYDVCSSVKYRGTGHVQHLIKSIKKTVRSDVYKTIWLGIKLDNSMWGIILRVYVNNGFVDPKLTRVTPGGMQIPFDVMSFTYQNGWPGSITKEKLARTIILANIQRVLYFQEHSKCFIPIQMNKPLVDYIRKNYIFNKDKQYGGNLYLGKLLEDIADYQGIPFREVLHPIAELKTGHGHPYFSIDWGYDDNKFPKSKFRFITHPDICYQNLNCFITWPSQVELADVFTNYTSMSILEDFIFTSDGIFSVQLTPECMKWIKSIIDQHYLDSDSIFDSMANYLLDNNMFGTKHDNSNPSFDVMYNKQDFDRNINLASFLTKSNSLTFQHMITTDKTLKQRLDMDFQLYPDEAEMFLKQNFNIFRIQYTSYEEVDKVHFYRTSVEYIETKDNQCMFEIYEPASMYSVIGLTDRDSINKEDFELGGYVTNPIEDDNRRFVVVDDKEEDNDDIEYSFYDNDGRGNVTMKTVEEEEQDEKQSQQFQQFPVGRRDDIMEPVEEEEQFQQFPVGRRDDIMEPVEEEEQFQQFPVGQRDDIMEPVEEEEQVDQVEEPEYPQDDDDEKQEPSFATGPDNYRPTLPETDPTFPSCLDALGQ